MKKYIPLVALMCVALLVAGSVAPAVAKGAKAKGAVRLVLAERNGTEGGDWTIQGNGPVVGWAIANTTADGRLVVQVHLNNGVPDKEFVVVAKINGSEYWQDDTLSTNSQGKGNAHYALDIPADSDGTIDVQVVLLEEDGYPTQYATATEEVPLKK